MGSRLSEELLKELPTEKEQHEAFMKSLRRNQEDAKVEESA